MTQVLTSYIRTDELVGVDMLARATFLRELVAIRDGCLGLSDGMMLSHDEVKEIIIYVCTAN